MGERAPGMVSTVKACEKKKNSTTVRFRYSTVVVVPASRRVLTERVVVDFLVPAVVKAEAEVAMRAVAMVNFMVLFGCGKGFWSKTNYEKVGVVGGLLKTGENIVANAEQLHHTYASR
jgi:hypothetical protein